MPIIQKRFIFEHSYISYRKHQKSCTLIVILVILSYQTSPILNLSSKSTGFFFANEEVFLKNENDIFWFNSEKLIVVGAAFIISLYPLKQCAKSQ